MKAGMLRAAIRDGRAAIEYQIQPGEMMDGMVLKRCKEGGYSGLLPMGAVYEDGHNYMYSYTDQRRTLKEMLSEAVTAEGLLTAFESIASTLSNLQRENVKLAYIVLDSDYIYMEEASHQVMLACMPGKSAVMEEQEMPDFFRTILANAVYLNSENGDYVAKLLTVLNRDFELEHFLRVIHGEMMDFGIPIPEPTPIVAEPIPQLMPQDATFRAEQMIPQPHLIRMRTGENIVLPEGEFRIGKSETNTDYRIADNSAVSRIHCTIIRKNGVCYVRDENSTNSTYVNGERVVPGTEQLLLNNCKLILGDEEFIYSLW